MVQKEIKKKTRIYGTVATLSAIVLVALIYVYGSTLGVFTPDTLPETSPMKTFTSYAELKNFLTANTQDGTNSYGGGPLDSQFFGSSRETIDNTAPVPAAMGDSAEYSANSYSTTNIQVEGVDEADIVKTDGNYIYVATNNNYQSASQNNVYIVKADTQDPRVIAKISLGNNTYVAGLFLSQDSSKLVVIGSQYQLYAYAGAGREDIMIYPYYSSVNTFLSVYDVSEKASPALARNLTLSGSYFNSRMIGNYVYAVVSQPTYLVNNDVVLPQVYDNAKASEIAPTRIYYADTADTYFTFTTFIGLNIMNDAQESTNMTVMMGGTSTMYVSLNNIYVTYPTWSEQGQYTSIYRVRVNSSELTFEAKGNVLGYVLNQYSMDEYNGYFRLATTSQKNQTRQNNVYVLDANLTIAAKLENLAEDERIYSARFMGDKCYLVTFRQMDPFFVLDMSNPVEPTVAGELKIPGYSSYLHPYDENHVVGLGKEDNMVKLSLFDVSNVNAPTEVAKYIVEGDYTDSEALQEPKAFLLDKQKDMLVIPISKTQYGVVSSDGAVGSESKDSYMQSGFWQGAYVFNVTASGFTLRGGITHQENTTSAQYYYGYDYNMWVHRALYIDNTLYTVSNTKVLLNNLDTLALITEVNLS
jgi:inhibitor of cysteine peptidase